MPLKKVGSAVRVRSLALSPSRLSRVSEIERKMVSIPEETPRNSIILWLAHHRVLCTASLGTLSVMEGFFLGDSLSFVQTLLFTAALLFQSFAEIKHDMRTMCIQCMQDLPLNGSLLAQRKMHALRFAHRTVKGVLLFSLILIALGFTLGTIKIYFTSISSGYVTPGSLLWIWLIVREHWLWTHHKLAYWCPWCKDNGGPPERVPDPDPVEKISA